LVTSGKDRSVRLWEKTQEIVVLDDERETERDQAAEDVVGDSQPVPGEQVVCGLCRRHTSHVFPLSHLLSET